VLHGNSCAMTTEDVRAALAPPIDLLYIDGDHSAEACLSDFDQFAPLVREAGLVIIDDYPASRASPRPSGSSKRAA
jgi:predicted O-methyltransferase YrrM